MDVGGAAITSLRMLFRSLLNAGLIVDTHPQLYIQGTWGSEGPGGLPSKLHGGGPRFEGLGGQVLYLALRCRFR